MSKDFLSRSSVMQSWGAYGVLWPVVHQQLGVSPDLGNGKVSVVPQIPAGQTTLKGDDILVGSGHLDVTASHAGNQLTTSVNATVSCQLSLGVVLPDNARVASVTLDGHAADARAVHAARGEELIVTVQSPGQHTLVVTLQ
jgi:hypothetical protein